MAQQTSSCQYIPTDQEKIGIPLIYGEDLSHIFHAKQDVVAVRKVDFGIKEGKITAIIGESGSGKTTLLKLIYGLLAPSSGEVRYRGWLIPTRKDKLIPGHDAMKLVSQGFDDLNLYAKVWDNIASQLPNTNLARKESKTRETLDRLKILHLAQQRVADLSGGEKQRVAIARAILKNPDLIILDEATSALDSESEHLVQQGLESLVSGRTSVIIAHRLSTVMNAHQILVLRNGEILERGTHKELANKLGGLYSHLFSLQTQGSRALVGVN